MKIEIGEEDYIQVKQLKKIRDLNEKVLELYANYIRKCPCFITKELVEELMAECGIDENYAYFLLLASAFDLDMEQNEQDMILAEQYIRPSIKKLDVEKYKENAYYKNIKIPAITFRGWELKYEQFEPYEAFIYNDIVLKEDFREIPRLGFFDKSFVFPAVLQNGVEWMTITPNELETQQGAIDASKGKVITFGLGLGYFAYMVSEKEEVESITVIEKDEAVIDLFTEHILPQFAHKDKVRIIRCDAFEYAEEEMPKENYDYAFVDLWHDISDGVGLYLRMKKLEEKCPDTKYLYWIEDSLLSNLRFCVSEAFIKEVSNRQEANKLMNIMQIIGEEIREDGLTAYELEFRHRLVAIAEYFANQKITCFEEMACDLNNGFLRKLAKII